MSLFFFLKKKIGENNFYFLKIILYFILFLKIVFRKQWLNSVTNF